MKRRREKKGERKESDKRKKVKEGGTKGKGKGKEEKGEREGKEWGVREIAPTVIHKLCLLQLRARYVVGVRLVFSVLRVAAAAARLDSLQRSTQPQQTTPSPTCDSTRMHCQVGPHTDAQSANSSQLQFSWHLFFLVFAVKSVCLFVCLSLELENRTADFTKFFCMLPVAVTRSSS